MTVVCSIFIHIRQKECEPGFTMRVDCIGFDLYALFQH